jgi:microsomal epoxide hydrolase
MPGYDSLPSGASKNVKKFTAHVSDEKLSELKQLVKLSPIGPITYENQDRELSFGMTRKWLEEAKEQWLNRFDWRVQEDYINSFPNFTVPVTDKAGDSFEVHFVALFSKKKDAIPIAFFHGWPGLISRFRLTTIHSDLVLQEVSWSSSAS